MSFIGVPDERDDETRIREYVAFGMSDPMIAAAMGVSARTILRRRHALGIGSEWAPPLPPHGTARRYGRPHKCRCRSCREANTEQQREYRDAMQRVTSPHAHNSAAPWTAEDDRQLLDESKTTAALARALGRSYDATRKRRERVRAFVAEARAAAADYEATAAQVRATFDR